MSPLKKILFCVAFGVLVTLVGLEAMVHALHESVDWPFWVFAVVSPAAVTATISIVLVRQIEANGQLAAQLLDMQTDLLIRADRDALTGVINRAAFYRDAAAYSDEAPACVLLADIDHFKAINDEHGHAAGDEALKLVASTLQAALRPDDLLGRIGGEEFAMLLCGLPFGLGMTIAERARGAIDALDFRSPEGDPIALSISVGVAPYRAGWSLDNALAQADAAMYGAKRSGRNRVHAAA
ncbi:GGDEF domain-containing protein [Sphingomonas ursincola]|jgi:diguanylate cyclase (GGDEF)-like protein|uniref:GGDEF domain-containing protein n=1 Tax=Sphingomonas ursincola TaxID=56361 RepID=UPI0023567D00|nr:GGDEF domain-containing protein [Sphingomonas ursincola]MBY0620884.1 GGDEF domain-containing protein [Sphingomonas ursincola]